MKTKHVLLVDGYNMIGDWPELQELKQLSLVQARVRLIERMKEYEAHTKWKIIIVFDAHLQRGKEKRELDGRVEVIYTRQHETADEKIERLSQELKSRTTQIYVATSDSVEQWVIFGQGALRKSAREMQLELEQMDRAVTKRVEKMKVYTPVTKIPMSDEVAETLERWRRGLK